MLAIKFFNSAAISGFSSKSAFNFFWSLGFLGSRSTISNANSAIRLNFLRYGDPAGGLLLRSVIMKIELLNVTLVSEPLELF